MSSRTALNEAQNVIKKGLTYISTHLLDTKWILIFDNIKPGEISITKMHAGKLLVVSLPVTNKIKIKIVGLNLKSSISL